jgi:hypothetical protein
MYRIEGGVKRDPKRRWALPDRTFFACGACHILAYAFLDRYPGSGFRAVWLKPKEGFTGNHIFVSRSGQTFDYHGYSNWNSLLAHTRRKACRWWPGWDADPLELPQEALISEARSRTYDGLWLREPGQFLHDALPRARRFLNRFAEPDDRRALRRSLATTLKA